jgi:trans-2,3-dihydro-3-hydroxyanthranilate isomerase
MATYPYQVLDVFTQHRLEGNPLAVFPDGRGLDDLTMQRIARELNLSETVFVVPPTLAGCAAKLRIFTPAREMKFAGHPTVGTAFLILQEGMVPAGTEHFILEENVGPVPVRAEGGMIWLMTPPISEGPVFERELCARLVGLELADLLEVAPQLVTAGNPTVFIPLRDREAVDRARISDMGLAAGLHSEPVCVFPFAPTPEGAYSRMFAPELGVVEDPATGSATGPLAFYMLRRGLAPYASQWVSEQGTKMGRRSILHVRIHGEKGAGGIEVGGHVTPVIRATLEL